MRVYLPATAADVDARPVPLAARPAHAVTPALRAALPDEDDEGLEFAAQLAAADASLALLAGLVPGTAVPLRFVVTAEVAAASIGHADDDGGAVAPSTVELTAAVAWADVVCVHVDEPSAAPVIAAALAGDTAAADRLADADLLWYDASELDAIPRP